MAKIFFVGLDGAEKSYRLQTHRPFTIGRDPGNDIILRDPKVSRHHAEIVFERGFFVLHDLASANGTYVNGKRIRVAPLTHGARLRMGNTYGRFSEELPTESDAAPLAAPAEPFDQAVPPTEDLSSLADILPTSQLNGVINLQTVPHEKLDPADLKKKAD
ncbi:MAG TPA: FHA domain-containing protein [Thermoanaerobaculia bacterium]|nr:FHA domain-containing protein [Thermoanaerobaculia bacterium]